MYGGSILLGLSVSLGLEEMGIGDKAGHPASMRSCCSGVPTSACSLLTDAGVCCPVLNPYRWCPRDVQGDGSHHGSLAGKQNGKGRNAERACWLQRLFAGRGNRSVSRGLQALPEDAELLRSLHVCGETSSAFVVKLEFRLRSPAFRLSH